MFFQNIAWPVSLHGRDFASQHCASLSFHRSTCTRFDIDVRVVATALEQIICRHNEKGSETVPVALHVVSWSIGYG